MTARTLSRETVDEAMLVVARARRLCWIMLRRISSRSAPVVMLVVAVAWFLLEREVDVLWVFAVAWFLPEREDYVGLCCGEFRLGRRLSLAS